MENHLKFVEIYELFLIYWTFAESYILKIDLWKIN